MRTLFDQEADDLIMAPSNQTHQVPNEHDDFKDDDINIFDHIQAATEDQMESQGGDGFSAIYAAYDGLESISVVQLKESTKENFTSKTIHNRDGKPKDSIYYDRKGGAVVPYWLVDTTPTIKFFIVSSAAILIGSLTVLCFASGLSASQSQTSEFDPQNTDDGGSFQQDQQGIYYNPPPSFDFSDDIISSSPSKIPSPSPSGMELITVGTPTVPNVHSSLFPTKQVFSVVNSSSFPTVAGDDEAQAEELLSSKEFMDFDLSTSGQPTSSNMGLKDGSNHENSSYHPSQPVGTLQPILFRHPSNQPIDDQINIVGTTPIPTTIPTTGTTNNMGMKDSADDSSYHPSQTTLKPVPPSRPETTPVPTTSPKGEDILPMKMKNDTKYPQPKTKSPSQTASIPAGPSLTYPPSPATTKREKSHITKFYILSKNQPKGGDELESLLSSLPKEADFLIHLGNWNTRKKSRCNANAYQKMSETYRKSAVPVLFVVSTFFLLVIHVNYAISLPS